MTIPNTYATYNGGNPGSSRRAGRRPRCDPFDVGSGSKTVLTTPTRHFRGRDASYLAPPAQSRTGPIRAYGLYGAFFVKGASRHFGRPLHSILLFDPRREHSSVPTAYFHRRRAQRQSRTALLQRRRRLVLDRRERGGRLPAIGWLAAR